MLATSSERDAHETIAAFRLLTSPSILVTVAMAYEGLDAPEVAVIGCLTHIRSRPWLEQMIARATRVDPHAGPVGEQRALVFHPDDPLFASFRRKVETEQGTRSRPMKGRPERYELPLWVAAELAEQRAEREPEIVPIESRALGMWFGTLAPGPEMREADETQDKTGRSASQARGAGRTLTPTPPPSLLPTPSRRERELRMRLADAVAAQAVEDEASERATWEAQVRRRSRRSAAPSASPDAPTDLFGAPVPAPKRRHERPTRQLAFGPHRAHRYNAILKRALGKARGEMMIAELEAALAWLERNRLVDHAHLLEGDERYAWAVRQSAGKRRVVKRRTTERPATTSS